MSNNNENITKMEMFTRAILDSIFISQGVNPSADPMESSIVHNFMSNDEDYLKFSLTTSAAGNDPELYPNLLKTILRYYNHTTDDEKEGKEGLFFLKLYLMAISNLNFNSVEIGRAVDNLKKLASISRENCVPMINLQIFRDAVMDKKFRNVPEKTEEVCRELAQIVLGEVGSDTVQISPEYMMFWQHLTLFAEKYLADVHITPVVTLYRDEDTLVQVQAIDGEGILDTYHFGALCCYLESVISELGGPLSSLRQLPQDLDPHNNECDEQTVSDRNTLLYFSELGKTHSSTDSDGNTHIEMSLGGRHFDCEKNILEYRYRAALFLGMRRLTHHLLEEYRTTGVVRTISEHIKKINKKRKRHKSSDGSSSSSTSNGHDTSSISRSTEKFINDVISGNKKNEMEIEPDAIPAASTSATTITASTENTVILTKIKTEDIHYDRRQRFKFEEKELARACLEDELSITEDEEIAAVYCKSENKDAVMDLLAKTEGGQAPPPPLTADEQRVLYFEGSDSFAMFVRKELEEVFGWNADPDEDDDDANNDGEEAEE